jgi:anthranilate synthase component 2
MLHKLLIVDNYDSFTYNLKQIVNDYAGWETDVLKHNVINLESVQKYDKIILSPGPGVPADYKILWEIINKYSSKKSILGICLGHQAINILDTNDYLFSDIPSQIEAGLYHSWAVSEKKLPSCLKITAMSSNNVIMAISHKELDIKGLQFHPESYMTPFGRQILFNWLNKV